MDTLEWNKIAGAILTTLLIITVIGHVGDFLVPKPEEGKTAVKIEGVASGEAGKAEQAKASGPTLAELLHKGSAEKGEKAATVCSACHNFKEGAGTKVGPDLYGIVGAKRARREKFDYSDALKKAGGTWDYQSLDKWLENPQKDFPGTKMTFGGIKDPQKRADIILYLRSLAQNPEPLPKVKEGEGAGQKSEEETGGSKSQAGAGGSGEKPAQEAKGEEAGGLSARLKAASAEKGKKDAAVCMACHSFEKGGPNKVGPNLYNVVGAKRAHRSDFNYSDALKNAGGTWDYQSLDKWLENPQKDFPGTLMSFAGIKDPKKRANIIMFLRSMSDSPPPLP